MHANRRYRFASKRSTDGRRPPVWLSKSETDWLVVAWQLAETDRLTRRLSRHDLLDQAQVRRGRRVARAALRSHLPLTATGAA